MAKSYICIDLKSFYASVECVERGLDPLNTNLVVADKSRTEKTICLAVSPSLKRYDISGRSRLYEVVQKVDYINRKRQCKKNSKKSIFADEIDNDESILIDYIVTPPRMRKYMEYSTKIYNIYLRFVSKEDIFAYSIDEVFCDITSYLKANKMTPLEMITKMIQTVYEETGITATGGIGTNMYLAKIAMDIVAKHIEPNEYGVRVASLDEISYRRLLWNYRPLTSFWRIGRGISASLEKLGIYTMGDICKKSIENEDILYKTFGVNAEFIIDHAWGWEPCEIKDVKAYRPKIKSLSSGQVLHKPYDYEHAKLIIKEMIDNLSLDLASKNVITDQIVLEIGYDIENIKFYNGKVTFDHYGRKVPKHAHGTIRLDIATSSTKVLSEYTVKLYEQIINRDLLIRRITISAGNLLEFSSSSNNRKTEQLNLFVDYDLEKEQADKALKEKILQETLIELKNKYGKNAILKGMNLMKGGTTIERNRQVGGHRG